MLPEGRELAAGERARITELERRLAADPASIAFAQLAEQYRRAGAYGEAVRVCQAGLAHHPRYLSARVTLGRALAELGQLEAAERELAAVAEAAPDNGIALRSLADVSRRLGRLDRALVHYERVRELGRQDLDLDDLVAALAAARTDAKTDAKTDAEAGGAGATGDAEREASFDFDTLVERLGVSESPAPPVIEALLRSEGPSALAARAGEEPPAPEARPHHASPADAATGDDGLLALEENLRRLEQPARPELPPDDARNRAEMPAVRAPSEDEAHVAALADWLAAIEQDRRARAAARV